jgi:glutamate synthase (NADPH/NADH) small chain
MVTSLSESRLETLLPDDKPLFSHAEARAEAERCLYCVDAPCIKACPTSIDIPTFIRKIATGNVRGSARTILEQNILGYSCARVCPVEVLCVGDCVYQEWHGPPIAIGRLQRYATETSRDRAASLLGKKKLAPELVKRVALIGGGPASLSCAAELALEGHAPVILEKRGVAGGLNTTGIAPYKMHASDAVKEAEWVQSLGVEVRTGIEVGVHVRGKDLLADYDAVFVGVGLGADSRLGVPGEDGAGVFGATDWIEWMKLELQTSKPALGHVVVVGGGNTAVDMARECARLGAFSVTMIYRRGVEAMSAYRHELAAARKEGVRVIDNTVPVSFVRDAAGKLVGLVVADAQAGRPLAGTEREVRGDIVGLAIGQGKLQTIVRELVGVEVDSRGCVAVDRATGRTANPKVYAGGDCVNGGKEVVNAVAEGRDAARAMVAAWSASPLHQKSEASRG